jgi:hypothetical protein
MVGVGDELLADEDLAWAGVVGDPGRDVDGPAEVVALLEHYRAGVQAHAGLGQAHVRDALHEFEPAAHALGRIREVEHHAVAEQLDRTAAVAVGEVVDDLDQAAASWAAAWSPRSSVSLV